MKKFVSLLLAVLMVLSCAAMAETTEARTDTIVFGTASFGQKFSPFFAANAYDQDVVSLTARIRPRRQRDPQRYRGRNRELQRH